MDSKIFVPRIPSLTHMATVKVAMNMYNEFHIETLDDAYRRIQLGTSVTSDDTKNRPGCDNAHKKLLGFPPQLRKNIMEAIHGLHSGVDQWAKDHASILDLIEGDCVFYFRCDGTIDTVQTAQQLALNSNIGIRKRFYVACVYCLEESIQALWTEMEATGQTGNLASSGDQVTKFWIRWLQDGCPVNWKRTIPVELVYSPQGVRFSSVFPSLRPESRGMMANMIGFKASHDDLRHCLFAMTEEEEKKVLTSYPSRVLRAYWQWPLRSLFLETAEKIFEFIDYGKYEDILKDLLNKEMDREVFDFYDIFERFWKCSPSHLRERANESSDLREKIELCFNEIRRKRKADSEEISDQKIKKMYLT